LKGDRDAALLLTLGENLDEHLRAAVVQFEIAELIDLSGR